MDNEMNYSFDAKFEGNILAVGRTGCSKMTFVQNLGKNKMFQKITLEVVSPLNKLTLNIQIMLKILKNYLNFFKEKKHLIMKMILVKM